MRIIGATTDNIPAMNLINPSFGSSSAVTHQRDAFLALCILASSENWCWKIWCSTCGHMYFRYGFKELVAGRHPDAPGWLVRQSNHHQVTRLGPCPSVGRWPMDEQRRLTDLVAQTDIIAIHRCCKFPDWLGYLGLALVYTEDAERRDRKLTVSLLPALMTLVAGHMLATQKLSAIAAADGGILSWRDLEIVESSVRCQLM